MGFTGSNMIVLYVLILRFIIVELIMHKCYLTIRQQIFIFIDGIDLEKTAIDQQLILKPLSDKTHTSKYNDMMNMVFHKLGQLGPTIELGPTI